MGFNCIFLRFKGILGVYMKRQVVIFLLRLKYVLYIIHNKINKH